MLFGTPRAPRLGDEGGRHLPKLSLVLGPAAPWLEEVSKGGRLNAKDDETILEGGDPGYTQSSMKEKVLKSLTARLDSSLRHGGHEFRVAAGAETAHPATHHRRELVFQ